MPVVLLQNPFKEVLNDQVTLKPMDIYLITCYECYVSLCCALQNLEDWTDCSEIVKI